MPFKSDKQRKYLFKNKPKVAKKLSRHSKGAVSLEAIVIAVIVVLILIWIF